ncbi:hypothetical protein AB0F17_20165 [Nonomuraea sp. NPDC026600]|uniref:glycosyltransferase family 9 protein n=1 Tax=Nonomuraea sp. NPDC026600 TaxID=3155363 RepID=UPI00340A5D59
MAENGHRVVVTGKERELTAYVAHDVAVDLGGGTTLSQLAALIERAGVLMAGDTGPAPGTRGRYACREPVRPPGCPVFPTGCPRCSSAPGEPLAGTPGHAGARSPGTHVRRR